MRNQCGGLVLPPVYQAANLIKIVSRVSTLKEHSLEFSEELIRMTCQDYFQQIGGSKVQGHHLPFRSCWQPPFEYFKDVNQIFTDNFHF